MKLRSICLEKLSAILLTAALLVNTTGCGISGGDTLPLGNRITNADEIVESLRNGLKHHASEMTISFSYGSDIFEELNGVIDLWMELALAETDDPTEGDYIRYQYGGYTLNSSYSLSGDRWQYVVTVIPEYYGRLSYEETVDENVARLMDEFGFRRSTSDYDKVKAIYTYLCKNVRYDKIHRKNPHSHERSTAYAALVLHTATCQGYCTALYRLLREAGISCRIVTGNAGDEDGLHAWVIAGIDGSYYYLDPTWDAGSEECRYFLFGSENAVNRTLSERFLTEDFQTAYPISDADYGIE